MEKLLLRPEEAAQLLGLGRTTVYELIGNGSLPSIRVGKVIRLRRADVLAWVEREAGMGRASSDPDHA